jgi:hypothetical protein
MKRLKEAKPFVPKAKEVVGPKPQPQAEEIGKIQGSIQILAPSFTVIPDINE